VRNRSLSRWVARCLLLVLSFLSIEASAQQRLVRGVETVRVTVRDLDRSLAFYTTVLPFNKLGEAELTGEPVEHAFGLFGVHARSARLQLGEEQIELIEFLAPSGRDIEPTANANDRSFQHVAIIVRDMESAYAVLRRNHVRFASSDPQRLPDWNVAAGGIKAFYFRDPDGHFLELLQFPDGKGDPRWHRAGTNLFLGIDHTAIVVASTSESLHFYRDLLGMRITGESDNYGTEQEHLNNVFGAHLRITALRGDHGPGIELLEYLAPRNGKPYPEDDRASDLEHWVTVLAAVDNQRAWTTLTNEHQKLISSSIENALPLSGSRFEVRDPDGHAIELADEN